MKTVFIKNIKEVDKNKLMAVYAEGIKKNAKYYNESIKSIENEHWKYLTEFLEKRNGILAILKDDEKYFACIRILPQENNNFFAEAFEVLQTHRGKGLGKQLYGDVIKELAEKHTHFSITATTWKSNTASIKAHTGVGFEKVLDYSVDSSGKKNENNITLCIKK